MEIALDSLVYLIAAIVALSVVLTLISNIEYKAKNNCLLNKCYVQPFTEEAFKETIFSCIKLNEEGVCAIFTNVSEELINQTLNESYLYPFVNVKNISSIAVVEFNEGKVVVHG